jgi:hypothetical protein
MNPIRRELLNGLLVLVVASLLSVAFSAFQVSFNAQLWVLILIGIAIAVSGYVVFEIALGVMAAGEDREKEWLKRVGTPARLELGLLGGSAGTDLLVEAVKSMRPGSDLTIMIYVTPEGGRTEVPNEARVQIYGSIMEQLKRGTIREYKRIICFDHDVLAKNRELKSGILRAGEGPGTLNRHMAEHCRVMLETKGCSLYVAPAVVRSMVGLYGTDKAATEVRTFDQDTGAQTVAGVMVFSDPPNGEIIEQLRQIERATERRMVAVHKIRFPEDAEPTVDLAAR